MTTSAARHNFETDMLDITRSFHLVLDLASEILKGLANFNKTLNKQAI